jgi:hypothetical protein
MLRHRKSTPGRVRRRCRGHRLMLRRQAARSGRIRRMSSRGMRQPKAGEAGRWFHGRIGAEGAGPDVGDWRMACAVRRTPPRRLRHSRGGACPAPLACRIGPPVCARRRRTGRLRRLVVVASRRSKRLSSRDVRPSRLRPDAPAARLRQSTPDETAGRGAWRSGWRFLRLANGFERNASSQRRGASSRLRPACTPVSSASPAWRTPS